jgi:DNA-binding NarL/FixJ family response regulator
MALSNGVRPRLFTSCDPHVLDAVAASGLVESYDVVPAEDVPAEVVASRPTHRDVVLLQQADLSDNPLHLASFLIDLVPAHVLVLVQTTRHPAVVNALRFGVDDVVLEPVQHDDLALRVALVQERARYDTTHRDGDVFDLLHELTNVVGAMQLTTYLLTQLALDSTVEQRVPDRSGPAEQGSPRRLSNRLEREVADVVALTREIERRVRALGTDVDR